MSRRGGAISRDVKAIVYRHVDDGELYVHGFGPHGERVRLQDLPDGVAIRRLALDEPTDAAAIANRDGTITLRHEGGKPLWADL